MCKSWARGLNCPFGDKCAFAHGEEQLQKKTHVAKQFRMTLCKSYAQQGFCKYGARCQFQHTKTDFSDFDQQKTRYQNLLNENALIMRQRMEQVEDPDVSTFNIAMPTKSRLSVFASIVPTSEGNKNNGQNK